MNGYFADPNPEICNIFNYCVDGVPNEVTCPRYSGKFSNSHIKYKYADLVSAVGYILYLIVEPNQRGHVFKVSLTMYSSFKFSRLSDKI